MRVECAGACLTAHRGGGLFGIPPDLGGGERDEKAKDDTQGDSIPAEIALNERARSPTARIVTIA